MTRSVVKIEIRVFVSEETRDANWEVNGDELLPNAKEYGVRKIDYALTEAQLHWKVRGFKPETLSFAKILGKPGEDEHYACHSKDMEIAVGWLFNP